MKYSEFVKRWFRDSRITSTSSHIRQIFLICASAICHYFKYVWFEYAAWLYSGTVSPYATSAFGYSGCHSSVPLHPRVAWPLVHKNAGTSLGARIRSFPCHVERWAWTNHAMQHPHLVDNHSSSASSTTRMQARLLGARIQSFPCHVEHWARAIHAMQHPHLVDKYLSS